MVNKAGIITTFAGNGNSGNGGDGQQATVAQLYRPQAVFFDVTSGSVYIADTQNGKIRVVTSNGIIQTFAGSNSYSWQNSYNCPATSSALVSPGVIAVDSLGNVYIGTGSPWGASYTNQVLLVAAGTNYITLFAGCGYGCYNYDMGGTAIGTVIRAPTGIAVDSHLNVYIATSSSNYNDNNQVLVVTHSTGNINVFAGCKPCENMGSNNGDGSEAARASLHSPSAIVFDSNDNLYIADHASNNVRLIANGTNIITTFAGTGERNIGGDGSAASSAYINYPSGLAVDVKGNLFIADENNNRIRKVTNSIDYPTSQPSSRPSTPSSQPSIQPTGKPSIFVWHPKEEVSCMLFYVTT